MTTRGATPNSSQQGRAPAAGIVQPDHAEPGGFGYAGERAVQVARLDRMAGAGGEDVLASGSAHGSRPHSLPTKGSDADRGQGERLLPAPSLGIVLVRLTTDALALGSGADLSPRGRGFPSGVPRHVPLACPIWREAGGNHGELQPGSDPGQRRCRSSDHGSSRPKSLHVELPCQAHGP